MVTIYGAGGWIVGALRDKCVRDSGDFNGSGSVYGKL